MLPDETIRRAIEDRLFGGSRVGPIDWVPASGGLSRASVWRVSHADQSHAVRRWWAGIDPRHVAWVAQTLREAQDFRMPFIAAPSRDDDRWPWVDAHDGRWEETPWLPGVPLSACSENRDALCLAVVGLARFHRFLRTTPGGAAPARPPIADRRQKLADLRGASLRVPSETFQAWPKLRSIVDLLPEASAYALRALASLDDEPGHLQPIHGDARPEHFLIEGSRLTGLIDFAAMRRDSPLADIARLAGEVALGNAAQLAGVVTLYEAASGRFIDRAAVAALDLSGAVLSAANWLRWLSDPAAPERPRHLVEDRLDAIAARLAPA